MVMARTTITIDQEDLAFVKKHRLHTSRLLREKVFEMREIKKKGNQFDIESKWDLLGKINKLEKVIEAYKTLLHKEQDKKSEVKE